MMTFVEKALKGEVLADDVDDFVDTWHEDDHGSSLAEFLGMTVDEYSLWVSDPGFLSLILSARHRGLPLRIAVNDNYLPALRTGARADRAAKIDQLQNWLSGRR